VGHNLHTCKTKVISVTFLDDDVLLEIDTVIQVINNYSPLINKKMKKETNGFQSKIRSLTNATLSHITVLIVLFFTVVTGCKKKDDTTVTNPMETGYSQINLVSDIGGYNAARTDVNLVNAWGIAIGPTGAFWISANHTGKTTIYDRNGAELLPAVSLNTGGAPTGVVYNSSANFMGAKFIYAGEDGKISGWVSGDSTIVLADRSSMSAVYKGLAIANDAGTDFIYAADFKGNHIDVFDASLNFITTKPFTDPGIPAGFAPFNIYNHDGKLYVTYAKQKGPDNEDDEAGPGNGYINIFNTDGSLFKRFASQGTLNSPWAIVDAPGGFGIGDEMILIGNFGDGKINVFNSDGAFQSQLKNNDNIISIDGLWALMFPENGIPAGDANQLFFTAGPSDETHGLFGYIKKK
jgi:uncharacterized protein (TIGR03118 family)